MRQHCEVCASFRPEQAGASEREVVALRFGSRHVFLCVGHARIAENSGVKTFEELRELYGSGRRSFVPRRAEAGGAKRERRRSVGRRADDAHRRV